MKLEELKTMMIEKLNNIEELKIDAEEKLTNQLGLKVAFLKQLEKIALIKDDIINDLKKAVTMKEVDDIRVRYLGKKGPITELYSLMSTFDDEQKKQFGKFVNSFKITTVSIVEEFMKYFKEEEINQKLSNEQIDITLPATKVSVGMGNIIENLIEELEQLLMSMGYDVVEGPELEQDLYNFELLNLPKGHPARDAQDTFYTKDDVLLLRSQTSPVQVRTMLENKEKTSIRIICPGKTYRRDDDDATHSHQFTQMEGLLVDRNISLADLKGTFDVIAKKLYGENRETRFRPSFYPFTEPSVELDISCFNCNFEGCSICKGTGWITVGGAGMVHPNVLRNCGYNPDEFTGFAFGFGIERLAMLKYGISDIRTFYVNDLRNVEAFNRLDVER